MKIRGRSFWIFEAMMLFSAITTCIMFQLIITILSGKTYYSIAEIKRILAERLVRSGDDALSDLMKNHQEYIETRKKNKPNK